MFIAKTETKEGAFVPEKKIPKFNFNYKCYLFVRTKHLL